MKIQDIDVSKVKFNPMTIFDDLGFYDKMSLNVVETFLSNDTLEDNKNNHTLFNRIYFDAIIRIFEESYPNIYHQMKDNALLSKLFMNMTERTILSYNRIDLLVNALIINKTGILTPKIYKLLYDDERSKRVYFDKSLLEEVIYNNKYSFLKNPTKLSYLLSNYNDLDSIGCDWYESLNDGNSVIKSLNEFTNKLEVDYQNCNYDNYDGFSILKLIVSTFILKIHSSQYVDIMQNIKLENFSLDRHDVSNFDLDEIEYIYNSDNNDMKEYLPDGYEYLIDVIHDHEEEDTDVYCDDKLYTVKSEYFQDVCIYIVSKYLGNFMKEDVSIEDVLYLCNGGVAYHSDNNSDKLFNIVYEEFKKNNSSFSANLKELLPINLYNKFNSIELDMLDKCMIKYAIDYSYDLFSTTYTRCVQEVISCILDSLEYSYFTDEVVINLGDSFQIAIIDKSNIHLFKMLFAILFKDMEKDTLDLLKSDFPLVSKYYVDDAFLDDEFPF